MWPACALAAEPVGTKFDAVLQPGCLLPEPEILRQVALRSTRLVFQIDAEGQVVAVDQQAITGNPEVDGALRQAGMACKFAPAYTVGGKPVVRTAVPDTQAIDVAWSAPDRMKGPARCIRPGYPVAAARAEETGTVVVQFRINPDDGQVEAKVREGSVPSRPLRAVSLGAVTQCLAHDGVRAKLPTGTWTAIAYEWQLN